MTWIRLFIHLEHRATGLVGGFGSNLHQPSREVRKILHRRDGADRVSAIDSPFCTILGLEDVYSYLAGLVMGFGYASITTWI